MFSLTKLIILLPLFQNKSLILEGKLVKVPHI